MDNIPPTWKLSPLGLVATLQRGFDLPVQSRRPGKYPIFAANGPIGNHDEAMTKGPGVVTGRSGSIGKVHFVPSDFWPLNTALWVRDFHGNDPEWVRYLLEWFDLGRFARGAAVPTLDRNLVHGEEVPVPPLEEQRRIVAKVNECMERIDEIDKLRALSDAESKMLLRSFYRDLYCDLRAKHDPIALRTVGRVTGGGTPSKQNAAYWTGDIPWVSPKDMKRRDIDSATDNISEIALSESSAKLIETPSVLFVVRGMILAHTLPVAVSRVPLAINQDMKAITPSNDFEVEYIATMLRGAEPDLLHSVEVAGHGTRRLQTEHWQSIPIPAMPAKNQREVVSMVREVEAAVDMLRDSCPSKEVGQLREAVLRKAFAGEL